MTREEAWALVCEYTQSESLRRHMLAVEAAMRAYAPPGEEEMWGLTGLLHDFDYERYPDVSESGHPVAGAAILRSRGVSEEVVRAILSHASEVTGVVPSSLMEKTLMAVDELTGFLIAVALVRPSRNLEGAELSSIKKKWKDKRFAAPVNREELAHHVEQLGVPLDEHIVRVADVLRAADIWS